MTTPPEASLVRSPDGRLYAIPRKVLERPPTAPLEPVLDSNENTAAPTATASSQDLWNGEAKSFHREITGTQLQKLAGTQRSRTPEDTLSHILPLSPAVGVTRLANITGLDTVGLPVVTAARPNGRGLAVAQGKGLDLVSAKASALMEAFERHQGERIALPLKLASFDDLERTSRVIDPRSLPQSRGDAFSRHKPILWAPGVDLLDTEAAPTWVPYEIVHSDWGLTRHLATGHLATSANGLASGNHLLEAVVHGLCEVIERDAETMLRCSSEDQVLDRRVDLSTIDDPTVLDILAKYQRAGLNVCIWDATSDVRVPTFVCLVADQLPTPGHARPAARGAGCHPNRTVAIGRALTEAAQSRLSFITGSRDDLTRDEYAELSSDDTAARTAEVIAQPARRHFHRAPSRDSSWLDDDLRFLLERLSDVGCTSAIALDLRRPELPIPVVRIVVPRLEADLEDGALPGVRAWRIATTSTPT